MAGTRAERLAKSRAVELSRLRIMLPRTAEPMVEECVALATELHERRVSRTKLMRMVLVRMHNELRALARSRGLDPDAIVEAAQARKGKAGEPNLERRYSKVKPKID